MARPARGAGRGSDAAVRGLDRARLGRLVLGDTGAVRARHSDSSVSPRRELRTGPAVVPAGRRRPGPPGDRRRGRDRVRGDGGSARAALSLRPRGEPRQCGVGQQPGRGAPRSSARRGPQPVRCCCSTHRRSARDASTGNGELPGSASGRRSTATGGAGSPGWDLDLASSSLGDRSQASRAFRIAYSINNQQPPIRAARARVMTAHPLTYAQAVSMLDVAP